VRLSISLTTLIGTPAASASRVSEVVEPDLEHSGDFQYPAEVPPRQVVPVHRAAQLVGEDHIELQPAFAADGLLLLRRASVIPQGFRHGALEPDLAPTFAGQCGARPILDPADERGWEPGRRFRVGARVKRF